MWIGQGRQQNSIDYAENGCGRANAEGEGDDGNHRETGIAAKLAQSVAEVLQQRFEPAKSPHVAALFPQEKPVSELPLRFKASVLRRHAAGDEFIDFFFQVLAHLVRQIAMEAARSQKLD
jgi:hypothetical protein